MPILTSRPCSARAQGADCPPQLLLDPTLERLLHHSLLPNQLIGIRHGRLHGFSQTDPPALRASKASLNSYLRATHWQVSDPHDYALDPQEPM